MKNKIILALLCVTLFCQSVTVFAENTEYDANENYTSSDELSNDSERTKIPIFYRLDSFYPIFLDIFPHEVIFVG